MTRVELLQMLVGRAKANGFEFRRWYVRCLGLTWVDAGTAVEMLSNERRYYALLFNHEFAESFWKAGQVITFAVPAVSFERRLANGKVGTVIRKGYTRRSGRAGAWRYHLKEMALAEEPLRYMRRYLPVVEELEETG